ncbi:hypothetical protein 3 [Hubei picorna-like virus 77]|uniref:hypothetical protein 3 n=1 Tax=Hubei picorna-like virus 77 TaxID=1923161 RepID=UPI00090B4C9E|nr:hypothetical protein 3 [Hubei picorna-like virus 77]APG78410.1 hypothetical protein 3 [Hubei picorna-like virus 77]
MDFRDVSINGFRTSNSSNPNTAYLDSYDFGVGDNLDSTLQCLEAAFAPEDYEFLPTSNVVTLNTPLESLFAFASYSNIFGDRNSTPGLVPAITTTALQTYFSKYPFDMPAGKAMLLQLYDNILKTPILYLKLYRGGYFTTSSYDAYVTIKIIPYRYSTQFISYIEENVPVPTSGSSKSLQFHKNLRLPNCSFAADHVFNKSLRSFTSTPVRQDSKRSKLSLHLKGLTIDTINN